MHKAERNRQAILNALRRAAGPVTSADLAGMLADAGLPLSERTIRLYFAQLDAEALTEPRGRRGRALTAKGENEVRIAEVIDRVSYLSARIDMMTYGMTFDLHSRCGQVVVNTSLVAPRQLAAAAPRICKVFADGYAMGTLLALIPPGQTIGDITVPHDKLGLCTVCSITLNGVLLKHGVPTVSRFGGLVELRDGHPTRFVEMIHYDATSIDPLEVFIRSGLTDYHGAIRDGNGLIGASFREVPENSRERVVQLAAQLKAIGLGAFLQIGMPGQSVLGVHASHGRIGAAVIGGLNPIAILEESGHRVQSRAIAGLLEYNRLIPYDMLARNLKQFL
ncbi:MAG: DUF128 domain-containing protein [Phycisphaeraceae bacterium]|nr:DUF128 domain-containing protein [Phycisphaeraceae bacterium]